MIAPPEIPRLPLSVRIAPLVIVRVFSAPAALKSVVGLTATGTPAPTEVRPPPEERLSELMVVPAYSPKVEETSTFEPATALEIVPPVEEIAKGVAVPR